MADLHLGETMSKKYRLIADNVAHTITDVGFRPDKVVVQRLDAGMGAAGALPQSIWYRDMTNADALQLRSIADNGATANTSIFFETTNGITLTTNASGVDSSKSAIGAITAITQANPAVVTDAAHGLATGDVIRITGVGGMVEVNNRRFRVNVVDANSFELQDPEDRSNIDSTNFTALTTAGEWNRLNRVDANRDVFDAETYDVVLGTACLTDDQEHVVEMWKFGEIVDLGDVG